MDEGSEPTLPGPPYPESTGLHVWLIGDKFGTDERNVEFKEFGLDDDG